jgi:L-aminopeptidase/D-esterase-like protein
MITDVGGIEVGHWTDAGARTGCTVVLLPEGAVASGEIRGGAPATREFALLDPSRTVPFVDAVVLSGGSAFGLAAGDGVMGWLERRGRGFETPGGRVPIVVGMSLYDLAVGDGSVRPGPAEGQAAAEAATGGTVATGAVGAGTGATVAKWRGPDLVEPGGIATVTLRAGEVVAAALVAVNAYGSIDDGTTVADPGPPFRPTGSAGDGGDTSGGGENTTIGVVATNASLSKLDCYLLAQSAHDGLARALMPAHTAVDGDGFVAVATGQVAADLVHLRVLVQHAVTRAVRSLAPPAHS